MAIREILEVPDPRLKTVSKSVEVFDEGLKALAADMFETMYAANGIGLAAIQVGEPIRLLVIDLQPEDPDAEPEECDHGGHHHTHQPVKREPVLDYVYSESGRMLHAYQYYETLPGAKRHLIVEQSDNAPMDNTQIYVVPPGKYFAMGDNRDNSQDSRYLDDVGYIPAENLIGRAEFIFFSHNDNARWWEVWKWPSAIRFDRIRSCLTPPAAMAVLPGASRVWSVSEDGSRPEVVLGRGGFLRGARVGAARAREQRRQQLGCALRELS